VDKELTSLSFTGQNGQKWNTEPFLLIDLVRVFHSCLYELYLQTHPMCPVKYLIAVKSCQVSLKVTNFIVSLHLATTDLDHCCNKIVNHVSGEWINRMTVAVND
jgi:hypothetical protein